MTGQSGRYGKTLRPAIVTLAWILSSASPALALQTHAYRGLWVHLGSHLFFLLAMIGFGLRIFRSELAADRSWRFIARGAWLLALWNVWAFSGHFLRLHIPESSVIWPAGHGQGIPLLRWASWREVLYYFLKMDHILTVPAILCFYIGLRGILAGDCITPVAGGKQSVTTAPDDRHRHAGAGSPPDNRQQKSVSS